MAERQFYAAIDLGTTNSVIAYGNINRNKMKPIVLELDRKNDTGSTSRSPLLPSVVFYYKNNEGRMVTDVGDYAKSRYGTRAGYVCKSVKSLMGVTNQVPLVDEIEDKTPADVSSQILSYMIGSAKKRLFQPELSDVVITVPASFDSDQCQATIDAARKAGINVDNRHDILLYEPKAVIYDFMRMQEDGEIPPDILSLDTEKNVLVYDLGGGTLDVTLHRVGCNEEGILNIRDIAISRYSLLGGDNFDELLALDMLKRFEETYGIKVSLKRRDEVMCKLRKLAEQLKTQLSMEYENARMSDIELPEDYEIDVMDISLYDAYAFEETYTRAEVEKIVGPLMGYQYSLKDVSRIQRMGEKDVDNIIYPVLDVLDKAGSDVKIDAVILNGGMTKFYLIQQRLTDLFGFAPLTTSDPDLAVARGAVYYHYCLHKYDVRKMEYDPAGEAVRTEAVEEAKIVSRPAFSTGTILNDTINLGLRGEYVSVLIPAGTELPYKSEEIRDTYRFEKATNVIGIELFLGRGKTKNLPNRRIATRVVKFAKNYPVNTPISFQIYINSMRMMTMEAWITGRPETKAVMEMDMASLKGDVKSSKGIGTVEKLHLNAKSEMNELKNLAERNRGKGSHDLNEQIKRAIFNIGQATNPEDFFEPCMEHAKTCKQCDPLLAYIYSIAIRFRDNWTDAQKRQIVNLAKRHFDAYSTSIQQNKYVLRFAMEMIAALGSSYSDFAREYLTRVPGLDGALKQYILQYVIRFEMDDEKAIRFLEDYMKVADVNKWISHHMIARFGRGTDKSMQKKLVRVVKNLANGLGGAETDPEHQFLVLLVAELCCNSGDNPLANDTYTMKNVWKAVKRYLDAAESDLLTQTVTAIFNGTELTEEEERLAVSLSRMFGAPEEEF